MVIYNNSQVISRNNFFDQVVRAALLEIEEFSIESYVVVLRQDTAYTLTFMVEAAPVIIVDFDSLASIDAYGLLCCGTFSRCLCDCAIVAGSCGAVAEHP